MTLPDFSFEEPLWEKSFTVIGIDEVGRGAFAGPVGIGGVVFSPNMSSKEKKKILSTGINDSKRLTPKKREYLAEIIKENCLAYETCFIDVETINAIGVGKASFMGMREAAINLKFKISNLKLKNKELFVLVDGFMISSLTLPQQNIIRGDSLSISIAAASIIAKVERDMLMDKLGFEFPNYKFEQHKGYGTALHRKAISSFGVSQNHRIEFCKKTLASL